MPRAPVWIGVLLNQAGFGHGVGYWVLLASMGVAIVGTLVVWVSVRAHAREQTTGGLLDEGHHHTRPASTSTSLNRVLTGTPMYVLEE